MRQRDRSSKLETNALEKTNPSEIGRMDQLYISKYGR